MATNFVDSNSDPGIKKYYGRGGAILLLSGGLDSFMTWRLLGEPPGLYVSLDHRYNEVEKTTLQILKKEMAHRYRRIPMWYTENYLDLGAFEEPNAYIPLRNLFLTAYAAIQQVPKVLDYDGELLPESEPADVTTILLAGLLGESSRDKSTRFFLATSRLFKYLLGRNIEVAAPFRHLTKSRLLKLYLSYFPEEIEPKTGLIYKTRSCYKLENYEEAVTGCGECMACFRRWVAFANNGLSEAERYYSPPWKWQEVTEPASKPSTWFSRLRQSKADFIEWPAIALNNLEAKQALNQMRKVETTISRNGHKN